ncbi:MAG: hypothetical protein R6V03_07610 [Kiritimatiellia bacterium]
MEEPLDDSSEIKDTDIVFDCPHCGKSLAIDYRGAGLTIPCTDCGRHVQVPIPEGMELTDIDSTEEEKEIRILNLRRSLAASELKAKQLQSELEELNERRGELEKSHSGGEHRFSEVLQQVNRIRASISEISRALEKINALARAEESK